LGLCQANPNQVPRQVKLALRFLTGIVSSSTAVAVFYQEPHVLRLGFEIFIEF